MSRRTLGPITHTSGDPPEVTHSRSLGSITHVFGDTNIQIFTGNGTWAKPSGKQTAYVQVWSPGGSGGQASTSGDAAAGGGGGGFEDATFDIDDLGATETVTVPAGGAAISTDDTNGNDGAGSSSFGTWVVVAPGSRGNYFSTGQGAGGNGGGITNSTIADFTGGVGVNNAAVPSMRGGGAGGGSSSSTGFAGGDSDDGGGGGGGVFDGDGNKAGGTSRRGGNGGTSADGGSGTAGTTPAGGGGASFGTGNSSGAGGDGKIIVISW